MKLLPRLPEAQAVPQKAIQALSTTGTDLDDFELPPFSGKNPIDLLHLRPSERSQSYNYRLPNPSSASLVAWPFWRFLLQRPSDPPPGEAVDEAAVGMGNHPIAQRLPLPTPMFGLACGWYKSVTGWEVIERTYTSNS